MKGYLEKHSDNSAAQLWLDGNILDSQYPPVTFEVNGVCSRSLAWEKTEGGERAVTDYENTDDPVTRYERKIVYSCAAAGLEITLKLTRYPDYPVVEYDAVMKNISSENSGEIKKVYSIDSALCVEKTAAHYMKGTTITVDDYKPFTAELGEEPLHLETTLGQPCEAFMPYFNFEGENGGVIAVVNWQGDWTADAFVKNGATMLTAGQYNCDFVLFAGEEYRFPGSVLLFYKGGWQEGQNVWRRWIIRHNFMRYTKGRDYKHNVFVCSYIRGWEDDVEDIKKFSEIKLDKKYNLAFEIDAGWHDSGDLEWVYTGNWTPNSKYGVEGLKKVSEAVHEAGMKFCLWMEPERFYIGSALEKELGDGAIRLYNTGRFVPREEYDPSTCMPWGVVNYASPAAVDTVAGLIDRTIKTYGVDIYRQDYNTHYYQFWREVDLYDTNRLGIPRYGITENHACTGYLEVLHRVFELNPGVLFDACASGGRRYDLETMRFGFMHTKSDFVELARGGMCFVTAQCQNFSTSWWYIITGTALGRADNKYDIRSRLCLDVALGIKGPEAQVPGLTLWSEVTECAYGDYYAISEYNIEEDGKLAMQFNVPESGKGLAVVYLRAGGEFTCRLMGLEDEAEYRIWDVDEKDAVTVMTGAGLMDGGYTVSGTAGESKAVLLNYVKI